MSHLLAKSVHHNSIDFDGLTLVGHLERTIIATKTICDKYAVKACANLGLKLSPEMLTKIVTKGAWIHDFGKANRDFQAMICQASDKDQLTAKGVSFVNNNGKDGQSVRHEIISVVSTFFPEMEAWLQLDDNADIILMAVYGHHYKAHSARLRTDDIFTYFSEPSFKKVLNLGCKSENILGNKPSLAIEKNTRD